MQNLAVSQFDAFHPLAPNRFEKERFNIVHDVGRSRSPFTVIITHDIDTIYPSFPETAVRLLKQKKFITRRRNPYWTFADMLKIERKYGIKSTWFFKGSGNPYPIDYPKLQPVLQSIMAEGHEIGLHIDSPSFRDKEKILQEKKRLETAVKRKVCGVRNHYLMFDVKETWKLQDDCGFKYDSTYMYADYIGYRNGFCHPFRCISLNDSEALDIYELPLTVMDCTLRGYMNLDNTESLKKVHRLFDAVKSKRGLVVINWHNCNYDDFLHPGMRDLFISIINLAREKGAWMPTMMEYYETHLSDS